MGGPKTTHPLAQTHGRAAHHSGAPSSHIGGLPGHVAAQLRHPPLALPLGKAMAHPSGAPLRPHRRPPGACSGLNSDTASGTSPREGYGTPLPEHQAAQQRRPPLAHPYSRATAYPSGIPILPHRRPPRACGGFQQWRPTGTPLRQPQSGAPPCAQIGGLPGHVAAPNTLRRPLRHASQGLMHTSLAHPSAHIGQISLGGVVDSQAASTREQDKRQPRTSRVYQVDAKYLPT